MSLCICSHFRLNVAILTEHAFLFNHKSKSSTYPFTPFSSYVTLPVTCVSALVIVGPFCKLNSLQQQKSVQAHESGSETYLEKEEGEGSGTSTSWWQHELH